MIFEDYLGSLIPHLSALKLDPLAKVFLDRMSDALVWTDEKLSADLSPEQMGCFRAVFRFRTSLITGVADRRFEQLWDALRRDCPQWIGFEPSRCVPTKELADTYHRLKGK